MNYSRIKNPLTGRYVKTCSNLGNQIIKNYIYQLGGQNECGYDEKTKRCNKKSKGHLNEKCVLGDTNRCSLKRKSILDLKRKADLRQNPVPIPMKILDKSMEEYDFKYGLKDVKYIEEKRFGFMWPDLEPLSLSDIVRVLNDIIKNNINKYSKFLNDAWDLVENLREQVNNPESKFRAGAIYNRGIGESQMNWGRIEEMNISTQHLNNRDDLGKLEIKELIKLVATLTSLVCSEDIMIKYPKPSEDEYYGQEIEIKMEPYFGKLIVGNRVEYLTLSRIVEKLNKMGSIEDILKNIKQKIPYNVGSIKKIKSLIIVLSKLKINYSIGIGNGESIIFNRYYL